MARLEELLAADDSAAGDVFEQARDLLVSTLGDQAVRLGRLIQDFDFPEALETLRELRDAAGRGQDPR